VDSLTTMEFVMAVEERFAVELDEKAVNRCRSVGELATLVAKVRRT
jgi:acyl carrier protein